MGFVNDSWHLVMQLVDPQDLWLDLDFSRSIRVPIWYVFAKSKMQGRPRILMGTSLVLGSDRGAGRRAFGPIIQILEYPFLYSECRIGSLEIGFSKPSFFERALAAVGNRFRTDYSQ